MDMKDDGTSFDIFIGRNNSRPSLAWRERDSLLLEQFYLNMLQLVKTETVALSRTKFYKLTQY